MRSAIIAALALAVAAVGACGDGTQVAIAISAPSELVSTFDEFVEFIPGPRLAVVGADEAMPPAGYRVQVVTDLGGCTECYRIEPATADERGWVVHASDRLGAQYGVAEVFELLGYRFRHPFDTYVPERPAPDAAGLARLQVVRAPAMRVRGLHLHTLHPIEAEYALWEVNEDDRRARQIFDWTVKNRGNFVQWVAMDDILEPTRGDAWSVTTAGHIEAAHRRGLEVGLGLQIFGQSSLQHGYDLIDDLARPFDEQIAERLPRITDGLPFDTYELSFGEFFGADPATFIATVDETYRQLTARAPQAEVTAVIHVGDSPDQHVTYMGEDLIYYFLVKFADPRIVPQVHTTMYYDLFEDAGGAYHHEMFDDHREFLLERLRAGLRVQYKPETAYWVAFDNSVPAYLPLYMLSRQLDRDRIEEAAEAGGFEGLKEELLFSTGWEWGYWQNDVASLRAEFEPPTSVLAQLEHQYAPDHPELPPRIVELALAQHDALIVQRLAAYQAGRDALIDRGAAVGIIAAPDRIDVDDVATLTAPDRAAFAADVVAKLTAYAAKLAEIDARTARLDASDRWAAEVIDGVAMARLRAQFIAAIYRSAVAAADGDRTTAATELAAATAAMDEGRVVVARRHGDLHDTDKRLTDAGQNYTLYQYGYLYFANSLCFWERERVMVANAVDGTALIPPGCFFP